MERRSRFSGAEIAQGDLPALAMAMALLTSLVACSGSGSPNAMRSGAAVADGRSQMRVAPDTSEAETTPASSPHPMMPGRIYAPMRGEIACPSQDFEPFLHAFLNSGDLQVRYTARPFVLKGPYHEQHNTEPGDPAHPQWAVVEVDAPLHGLARYDNHLHGYVHDISRLRPGQRWTGVDAGGLRVENPAAELQFRRVSETEYAVGTPGRITTFSKRGDCWYLTHDWSLDPFEGCQWPDECRRMREHEDEPLLDEP